MGNVSLATSLASLPLADFSYHIAVANIFRCCSLSVWLLNYYRQHFNKKSHTVLCEIYSLKFETNFNKIHCLCNPMVFFLILHLFALRNFILKRIYRLHQMASRSISQKTIRTLPLRSKKKDKAEILLIKFPNVTILLLAKKADAPLWIH